MLDYIKAIVNYKMKLIKCKDMQPSCITTCENI